METHDIHRLEVGYTPTNLIVFMQAYEVGGVELADLLEVNIHTVSQWIMPDVQGNFGMSWQQWVKFTEYCYQKRSVA